MKKDSFVKDALVLTAITLISGLLLGGVYGLTKDPIEKANNASTYAAYEVIMPAENYDSDLYAPLLEKGNADAAVTGNGATLISAVAAKDGSGAEVGYLIKGKCAGYGGDVVVVVGVNPDLTISGIAFPETLPETAGLGQKATLPEFYEQFVGKGMNLTVKKGGGAGESEIDAISGATITSASVVNTVNAATEFVQDYILK